MIDAIVCVSNPTAHIFEKCLEQLRKQKYLNKIIIVHPYSDSFPYLNNDKIDILREPKISCLANARRMGIRRSQADFICFVDADVILHTNHFQQLYHAHRSYGGIIEGILTILENNQEHNNYQFRILKNGERGFTHNTLMLRSAVVDWNPIFTCAWEDYLLTQHVHKQGYLWVRYPQKCVSYHIKDYGLFKRNCWGTAGERLVCGIDKKTILFRSLNYFKRAIFHPFLLRNVHYAISNIQLAFSSVIGYFNYNNYVFLNKQS